jgi:hypothetical protein
LGEEIGPLKKSSIPHLNTMEWQASMSGNTTRATPEVCAKAILTPMCARILLAIWARGSRWQWFVPKNFYENAMPSAQIFFEELILRLVTVVQLQPIYIHGRTHLSASSGTLGYLVHFGITLVRL